MPEKIGNILSWVKDPEPGVIEQAKATSNMPFLSGPVALMPDAHVGMGATIGSVLATKGAVVPSAVGVDIGCGMIAARSELTSNDLKDNLDGLHNLISESVPAGLGKWHLSEDGGMPFVEQNPIELSDRLKGTAAKQLGSLGSGNHFIEVCLDELDRIWIVLHSGSRGVGKQLADIHINQAKKLMKQYFIELEDPDLAYLVQGTDEYKAYIAAMHWAQEYAMLNRSTMLRFVKESFAAFLDRDIAWEEEINCHHNFSAFEHHRGQNVLVTRKGAIRAQKGDLGVIPGSMGTASYIVEGLGNPSSYCSCSHGAGRRMSRTQARKTLDLKGLEKAMEGKSWNRNSKDLIDEDPRAYKDIDVVMEQQQDLVSIKHKLRQILNYKGV